MENRKSFGRSNDRGGRSGGGGGYSRGGGGGGFSRGGGRGGSRDGGRPEMHDAVCGDCGADCQVPFRPSGDKPVFCSDCFRGKESYGDDRGGRGGDRRDSRDDRGGRGDRRDSRREDKEMFEAVCCDCGSECEIPFRPSPDRPVYCDKCFGKNKGGSSRGGMDSTVSVQLEEQFALLNAKLDALTRLLSPKGEVKTKSKVKAEVVEVAVEPQVKEKKVAKKAKAKKTA